MMDVPVYKRFDFRMTDVRVNRHQWRNAERLRLVARLAADLRVPGSSNASACRAGCYHV